MSYELQWQVRKPLDILRPSLPGDGRLPDPGLYVGQPRAHGGVEFGLP